MWKDILVILIILVASYLFTVSSVQRFDLQLIFILLTLIILILYKIIYYKKQIQKNSINENFQNNLNVSEINNWLGSVSKAVSDGNSDKSLEKLSNESQALQNKLDTVQKELLTLKEMLTLKDKKDNEVDVSIVNALDTTTIQSNQNENLKKLASDIQNAKQILEKVSVENVNKEYPKIPVYSSCVVSNADGGYSKDTPNKDAEKEGTSQDNNQLSQTRKTNYNITQAIADVLKNGINLNLN